MRWGRVGHVSQGPHARREEARRCGARTDACARCWCMRLMPMHAHDGERVRRARACSVHERTGSMRSGSNPPLGSLPLLLTKVQLPSRGLIASPRSMMSHSEVPTRGDTSVAQAQVWLQPMRTCSAEFSQPIVSPAARCAAAACASISGARCQCSGASGSSPTSACCWKTSSAWTEQDGTYARA